MQSWHIHIPEPSSPLKDSSGASYLSEQRLNLIFPGTKWCGSGDIAENYDDLGPSESTDKCCREHDMCKDVIESGKSAHGLTNDGYYTKLNCECDEKFLKCLRSDSSQTSHIIGVIYFDTLNTQCFKEEHPILKCSTYYKWPKSRCKEYKLDKTSLKKYQYFDVPLF